MIQPTGRPKRAWKDTERVLLMRDFKTKGGQHVAHSTGHSLHSVYHEARKLGVTKRIRLWSIEEDEMLRQRYPAEGASSALCEHFGRSKAAIHTYASKIGIAVIDDVRARRRGHLAANWKGHYDRENPHFSVPATVISKLRGRVGNHRRPLTLALTEEDIHKQIKAQSGKCAKTGRAVSFMDNTASVDRIDSVGHYTPDNIRITTVMANVCRLDYSDKEMDTFCKDWVTCINEPISAAS